jgi:hypothetical protein
MVITPIPMAIAIDPKRTNENTPAMKPAAIVK